MMRFDAFFDTYDKRRCLIQIVTFLCWLLFASINLYCAICLYKVDNYNQVFAIKDNAMFQQVYIVRVILEGMSLYQFNIIKLVLILLSNLHALELGLMVSTFLAYHHKDQHQKWLRNFIILSILTALLVLLFVILAFKVTSFGGVIEWIHKISIVVFITSFIQVIVSLLHLYQLCFKEYREALQYKVIIE
ncbi:MAG: hypothetical protein RR520_05875 [Erysipelotrichaceae bacterium]